MEKATLSVIIPVYNKAQFLRRCLDSIVAQTDKDAQVIVIDDGSTDGSGEICDEYKKFGFEVYHTRNNGVSSARNKGIRHAKGEWITFLDADDDLQPEAFDIMKRIGAKNVADIVQFGHFRDSAIYGRIEKCWPKGYYRFDETKKYWVYVWNKIYRASLIKKIRFIKGLQFGEDELFNVEALIKAGSLYHAPQSLINHHFDDLESLCRKNGLPKEKLDGLIEALKKKRRELKDADAPFEHIYWIQTVINGHLHSPTFIKRGYKVRKPSGRYDVVYMLKESAVNEELRYSLRSVEKNWKYRNVVFCGGCPDGITPDKYIARKQTEPTKWERVRASMRAVCENEEITEDFWLFNDDFFIMQPIPETMKPQYNGDLYRHIVKVEDKHGENSTEWTRQLRHLCRTLSKAGCGTKNYAVHKPILINRYRMLEVLDMFPDEPMLRALYGNYWNIGGVDKHDMKVLLKDYPETKFGGWEFLSTQDDSFEEGIVGEYIRRMFNDKSRFEV